MNAVTRSRSIERTLTQADFERFAELTGDVNPIHTDPGFAATTRFGRCVSHGMLLATVLRGLMDELVPRARLVSQELKFPAPTYADEMLRFSAEVVADDGDEVRVAFRCAVCADGKTSCEGSALLCRQRV